MKKLQQIRLNIKIYTIWRLQFLGVLLISRMQKKDIPYDEDNN